MKKNLKIYEYADIFSLKSWTEKSSHSVSTEEASSFHIKLQISC